MERDQYRTLIRQIWTAVRLLEPMPLLNVEIAARRWGTRDELQAASVLRRAMDDIPKAPEQP